MCLFSVYFLCVISICYFFLISEFSVLCFCILLFVVVVVFVVAVVVVTVVVVIVVACFRGFGVVFLCVCDSASHLVTSFSFFGSQLVYFMTSRVRYGHSSSTV